MSKILVTGAAGYVGGHMINRLLEDDKFSDYKIIGVDNFVVGDEHNYDLIKDSNRVELTYGDISDPSISEWFKDVEIVYHLAAISGVAYCNQKPILASKINIEGTLNLLELSAQNGVESFVYPSSAAVYGEIEEDVATEDMLPDPLNKYGAMKASCESLCKAYYNSYGLGTTILRFTNIYGVGTYPKWRTVVVNFIRRALSGEPVTIHGSGEQKRDFIHIDDVIHLYKLALSKQAKGKVFNAGSGHNASVKELADAVIQVAKDKGIEVGIEFKEARESKERTFSYDTSRAREILNFEPHYDLEAGIARTFQDIDTLLNQGFKEYQKDIQ
ncbi:MAG: NAD-dependent epimerase/dehydratase family protein [Halobacteriota archaeon]